MEEPTPSRDHDPLPAVRPGGRPRGQVQGLLWLFSSFPKATFSLPRALPSWPASPRSCTAAGGGVMLRGKPKLVMLHFLGDLRNVLWLNVIERGLWGTKKHHGMWL